MIKLIVADTETCGFNPPKAPASGVVQVAFAEIDDSCNVLDMKASLINPGAPIDPGAAAVHGIWDADVEYAPKLEDVFAPADPVVLIGHNVPFDFKFLGRYIDNLAGTLCTLQQARLHIRNTKNHKLQTLADELNLERGEAHDAGGDVITTISLLKHLCEVTGRTVTQMWQAGRKPAVHHVMPFGKHKGEKLTNLPLNYIRWFLDQEIDQDLRMSFEMQLKLRG